MCGIAGFAPREGAQVEAAVLDRLAGALAHRGPDGQATATVAGIGLVHTRLSIIDLETGDQPLYDPAGRALVANGEVYNYVELRVAMPEVGFKTASDCEPALALYARHGLDFARHVRGMYALAVADPATRRLVLARDPFGIKPLYYVERPDGIGFASEPRALIAAGLARADVEDAPLRELLQLRFTTGRQTVFKGIQRVLPGEVLAIEDGRIVERRRQPALTPAPSPPGDLETALAAFDAAWREAVEVHQRSDVPYGLFLSGGIDSAALLARMAELNDRPVRAFTAGFDDPAVGDERARARAIAQSLGAEHVEIGVTAADFWRILPRVARAMDDPAADYATIPTFLLAGRAGQELKVVLAGEGGDEVFAGYGRYRAALRPWWRGGRTMRAKGPFEGEAGKMLTVDLAGWRDGIKAAETRAERKGYTGLKGAQAVDMADWLPNGLLTKLDRCLMAHGVEGRVPFLDPAVAAFGFGLPDSLKIDGKLGKILLRRWLADRVPAAQALAPKSGFTVPVGGWIKARGREIGTLVAAQPGVQAIARAERVVDLFGRGGKHAGFAQWTLLFYAVWHQVQIMGVDPGGETDAVLAAR